MSKKLQDKVAVITGGSEGIGLATAQLFVNEGAHVIITGRRQSALDAAVKQIGKGAMGVQCDVSKSADLDHLYEVVKKQKGHIDILFANAGVYKINTLEAITEEHYDEIFDINVKGLLFSVQKALPIIRNGGSIILNASVAASIGSEGLSVYCASKAAVRSFARCWSVDLKERKIRTNVISPGVIPTVGFSNLPPEVANQFIEAGNMTPLGRPGKPEEVAKAALFLATEDSSYITGIELFVDGGFAQV